MITRLEIDGFKSLRDFAVDLEPFTVFIGPNSAGKSNILEALALLSRLATQPIAQAFKNGRGRPSDQFTRTGTETARTMRFAVEFLVTSRSCTQSRFRYELTVGRKILHTGAERLGDLSEDLSAIPGEADRWIESRPAFRQYATDAQRSAAFDALLNNMPASSATSPALQLLLPELVANLAGCRTLQMGTAQLGAPSDRIDSGDLAPDASNLPTVLAALPPALLGEIRADLVALVPGIASFEVVPDGDELRIDFELSGGDRMPARLVSDGTLRLLVLLTALRLEPRPHLACIEEPENGIYPGRLRALLDLFKEETTRSHDDPGSLAQETGEASIKANLLPTQILITTHSPVILAALRKHPEHLRFVDMVRRGGHRVTRVRTVGPGAATDHGRFTVSPREIDLLLNAAQSEDPA